MVGRQIRSRGAWIDCRPVSIYAAWVTTCNLVLLCTLCTSPCMNFSHQLFLHPQSVLSRDTIATVRAGLVHKAIPRRSQKTTDPRCRHAGQLRASRDPGRHQETTGRDCSNKDSIVIGQKHFIRVSLVLVFQKTLVCLVLTETTVKEIFQIFKEKKAFCRPKIQYILFSTWTPPQITQNTTHGPARSLPTGWIGLRQLPVAHGPSRRPVCLTRPVDQGNTNKNP